MIIACFRVKKKNGKMKKYVIQPEIIDIAICSSYSTVRDKDSSAARRLFFRLAGAVGRQRALHTENSGFAHATLPWHISEIPLPSDGFLSDLLEPWDVMECNTTF
jgi:hypothetical protein